MVGKRNIGKRNIGNWNISKRNIDKRGKNKWTPNHSRRQWWPGFVGRRQADAHSEAKLRT